MPTGWDLLPKDWSSLDSILIFCLFFVPGFISSQFYGLFVGVNNDDFAKRLPAIVGYSAIHFGLTGWLFFVAPDSLKLFVAYIVVFLLPVLWPPIILLVRDREQYVPVFFSPLSLFGKELKIRGKRIWGLNPSGMMFVMQTAGQMPWDMVLKDPQFVRVRLKSGRYVGGYLDNGSWLSTYPSERQLYIAQAYEIDAQGSFGNPIKGTGVLIMGDEVELLETISG